MEGERKHGYLLCNTFIEDEDEEKEEIMTCMKEECKEERKTF